LKRRTLGLVLWLWMAFSPKARAGNEILTVPLVLADYYGWAYTEAFQDHADIYAWSTAGVDALGWTLIFTSRDYAGLFMVNVAGLAKTVYPAVALLGAKDSGIQERALIALGTHATTLLALELFGHPAISVQSSMGPSRDGLGLTLACRF